MNEWSYMYIIKIPVFLIQTNWSCFSDISRLSCSTTDIILLVLCPNIIARISMMNQSYSLHVKYLKVIVCSSTVAWFFNLFIIQTVLVIRVFDFEPWAKLAQRWLSQQATWNRDFSTAISVQILISHVRVPYMHKHEPNIPIQKTHPDIYSIWADIWMKWIPVAALLTTN